jgi:uncharacterized protein (TIGR00661 family)
MAKIIYGVAGEGSGHSSRAREIATHLVSVGHEVRIVTYGQGLKNLSDDFSVHETEGLHFATSDNKVKVARTIIENLSRLPRGGKKALEVRKLFKEYGPDCIITDFEPMTAYFANHYDLPLVTIDNQHRMRYMQYPCPRNLRADALAAVTVIRAIVPKPDISLVTTFHFGDVKNDRTFLFPPILRREVLSTKPERGKDVLVYVTRAFDTFLRHLRKFPREQFTVYGTAKRGKEGNIEFKGPSREGFLKDLASCKAVIATAGFTLMTESLYLHKPYMALPMKGQFEQELNGLLLADLGYGKNCRRTTTEAIGDFLYRTPEYRRKLAKYRRKNNEEILQKLDDLLANGCALAKRCHRRGGG